MIDNETVAAIHNRAKQLADEAPPFTIDQSYLLVSLFSRYSVPSDHAEAS